MLDPKPEIWGWISLGCLWNQIQPHHEGKEWIDIQPFWKVLGTAWRCWGEQPGGKIQCSEGSVRIFLLLTMLGRDGEGIQGGHMALGVSHTELLGFCPSGAALPVPDCHFCLPRVVFRRSHLCPPGLLPQRGDPPAQQPPRNILGLPR